NLLPRGRQGAAVDFYGSGDRERLCPGFLRAPALPDRTIRLEVEREFSAALRQKIVRGRREIDPHGLQSECLALADNVGIPTRIHRDDEPLFAARDAAGAAEARELFDHLARVASGECLPRAGEITFVEQLP